MKIPLRLTKASRGRLPMGLLTTTAATRWLTTSTTADLIQMRLPAAAKISILRSMFATPRSQSWGTSQSINSCSPNVNDQPRRYRARRRRHRDDHPHRRPRQQRLGSPATARRVQHPPRSRPPRNTRTHAIRRDRNPNHPAGRLTLTRGPGRLFGRRLHARWPGPVRWPGATPHRCRWPCVGRLC